MSVLECPACGAPLKPVPGTAFLECEYCGSQCPQEGTGTGPTCESLTLRGEICLRAGQWSYAANCFQRALEIAPMYAPAYYGSLLAALHCKDEEELSLRHPSFGEHSDYQNAMRYGDDGLRRKLQDALLKAETNEARRIEEAHRMEEARKTRERKKQAMISRHREEQQALFRRNRRKMWRMWLLTLGTLFAHLTFYIAIETFVDQIFGYRLSGSTVDRILSNGSGAIFMAVISMVFMNMSMLRKSYSQPDEKKLFLISLLCLAISLLFYLACIKDSVVASGSIPMLLVTLPVLILPCGIAYPIIFTAKRSVKSLKQLREEQRQELDDLMAAEP